MFETEHDRMLPYARVQYGYLMRYGLRPGWFYIVQLVPELQPNRVKFGFARHPHQRLVDYRVSSPGAVVVAVYPIVSDWEKELILELAGAHSVRLTSEAYIVDDLARVLREADRMFKWAKDELSPSEYAATLKSARNNEREDDLIDLLLLARMGEVHIDSTSLIRAR